jgi:hypothetical protein
MRHPIQHNKILQGVWYMGWIFVAWSLYVMCVYGKVLLLAQPAQGIVNEVVRWLIFVSPAAWMLWRHVASCQQLGLWGLKRSKVPGSVYLISAYAIIGVLHLIVIQHKKARWPLSPEFWLTSFSTSTIAKEISFRGLLFFFFDRLTPKIRIILSAIPFTGIYCPASIALVGVSFHLNTQAAL